MAVADDLRDYETGVDRTIELPSDWQPMPPTLECRALLVPEDGGYVVHCLRLPGVVSQGDTVQEALANIEDAFREAIRSYRDAGDDIPWEDVDVERTNDCLERWILVNV